MCDPILNLPTKSISKINLPIAQDYEKLKQLVGVMKKILGNNFIPSLGMFGGLLLAIAFQAIIKRLGYCPMVLATGGLSCGKTTTLKSILFAMGSYPLGENEA